MMKFNYNTVFDNIPDKLKAATIEKKELFVHEKVKALEYLLPFCTMGEIWLSG